MNEADFRFCKKCLLEELSGDAYRTVQAYIENLPEIQKVPDREYRQRLEICRQCRHFVNAMCELCGCFVELRAAKKQACCADTPPLWLPFSPNTQSPPD